MIELVLAVCMVGQPAKCRDVYLNFEAESVTPQQCMMYGQMEMAKWAEEHPDYTITKWRCGVAGQMAKI